MSTDTCFTPVQAVRLRVAVLAADGTPAAGSKNLYVTDSLVQLGYNVTVEAGAALRQKNGSGSTCLKADFPDQVSGVTLSTELCHLDSELIEMLTQATLVQEGGITKGFALPDVGVDLNRRVSCEAWAKAWDGDQQAASGGNALHFRFIFPSTSWVLGNGTLQNDVFRTPLTGKGQGNAQFGDGPANDLPWGEYTSAMGVYLDDNPLPDPFCGYSALAAS